MRSGSRRSTSSSKHNNNNTHHAPDHHPIIAPAAGSSSTSLHEPTQPPLCRDEASSPKRFSSTIPRSAAPRQVHQDCGNTTEAAADHSGDQRIGDPLPASYDALEGHTQGTSHHSGSTTPEATASGAQPTSGLQPASASRELPVGRRAVVEPSLPSTAEAGDPKTPDAIREATPSGDDDDEPHLQPHPDPARTTTQPQPSPPLGHVSPSHFALSSSPPVHPNNSIASHQSSIGGMNGNSGGIDERPLLPSEAAGGGEVVSPYGTADNGGQPHRDAEPEGQGGRLDGGGEGSRPAPPPPLMGSTDATFVDDGATTSRFPFTIAIVNPLSGERSASDFVYHCLCDDLGPSRVLRLNKELFSDPRPIRELMLRAAVRRDNHEEAAASGDGAAGSSDGHRRRATAPARGTVVVSGGDGTVAFVMSQIDVLAQQHGVDHLSVVDGVGVTSPTASEAGDAAAAASPRMPAVAVLALGTGNDFSNCMGFGNGYTKHKLCCMCVCCVNHVSTILSAVVKAPATKFDRWVATIGPQQQQQPQQASSSSAHHAGGAPGSGREVIFMNYFSLGMDAFIATHFDRLRKKYPAGFQYRFQNKGWYGALGLYGAAKCSALNALVPKMDLLIEASAAKSKKVPAQTTAAASSSTQQAAPPITASKTMLSTVLPPKTKALVLSNVNSYSGGTVLWHPSNRGAKYCATQTPSTVYVNDKLLEVQALGGLVDMTMLQLKVGSGADKLAQAQECVLTVGSPSASSNSNSNGAASSVRRLKVPVPMQADGEPIGAITEPSSIHVRLYDKQIYVRCANRAVVKQRPATAVPQHQAPDMAHLL